MHSIRLRDPWDVEPAAGGLRRHRRYFNKPTGLEPDDQVWVVIQGTVGLVELTLNGASPAYVRGRGPSGHGEPSAFDVTTLLNLRNELVIVTDDSTSATRGEVQLQIVTPPANDPR